MHTNITAKARKNGNCNHITNRFYLDTSSIPAVVILEAKIFPHSLGSPGNWSQPELFVLYFFNPY